MLLESINCQKSKPYFLFSAVIHDKHSSYDIQTQNLYTVKVKTVYGVPKYTFYEVYEKREKKRDQGQDLLYESCLLFMKFKT